MQKVTNELGICLPLAVWALHDEYDYDDTPNYISATTLMKPLRQIILNKRVPLEMRKRDVSDLIASALGKSLHDSIEKAWTRGYVRSLRMLGYPENVIDKIRINPADEELSANSEIIPVYLEQRVKREIDGFVVGGKYDLIAAGILHDNKSTSAYSWVYASRDTDHAIQGSIYRWLNPEKITEDYIRINYIFTDWQKSAAKQNPDYPQKRLEFKDIPLMTMADTEQWIRFKLNQVKKYKDADEKTIPFCTDEELWLSEPTHKYYSDPAKTSGRSTKNFDTLQEANKFMAEKGKGVVITSKPVAKRCEYCDCSAICSQYQRMQEA